VSKPLHYPSPATPQPPSTTYPASLRSPLLSNNEGSLSTTASQHSGSPLNIRKELAQDIETAGGIKILKANENTLSLLCNARENVYGKRGQPIRQQIQKKVYHWKVYEQQGIYMDKVLNQLNVKSIANLKKPSGGKKLQFKEDDAGLSDSDLSSGLSLSSTSNVDSTSPPFPKSVSTKKRKENRRRSRPPRPVAIKKAPSSR
jgi:hypothetical protein